jgi:hypothetical protein
VSGQHVRTMQIEEVFSALFGTRKQYIIAKMISSFGAGMRDVPTYVAVAPIGVSN